MAKFIDRAISSQILAAQQYFPVICVTGPRQSGKTSLCKNLFSGYKYVNLEDLAMRSAAINDPIGFLNFYGPRMIIDEVQNVPQLLSMIQVRVDEDSTLRYVITGSSNFSLMASMSQSLAGRVAVFTLLPLSLKELPDEQLEKSTDSLMLHGLYPGTVAKGAPRKMFFSNYYDTYVKRDVLDLLKVKNLLQFDNFIRLLAARAGSEFNASTLSKDVGVSSVTITEWFSILTTSYIAFAVRPFYANIPKRLTKMPKAYFYDTGLLCFLLGINTEAQLAKHPLRGAIFENFAISEIIKSKYNIGEAPIINFYREHSGKEVDIMVQSDGAIQLYEVKSGQTYQADYSGNMKYLASLLPAVSSSTVIYDGESIQPIAMNIRDIGK